MSRDGDRRAEQFVIRCASGVSSALWPSNERHYVATNWFAQQRRFFIMRGVGWSSVRQHTIHYLRLFYSLLLLAFLVTGIVLALFVFQYWTILFILATVWSVLIVFVTRLLCDKIYHIALVKLYSKRRSSRPRSRPLSVLPQFPETPMPATPLIRVLETIDLSTMDVEQFIANEVNTSTQIPIPREEEGSSTNIPQ